jgi:hypothetical protein
MPATPAVAALPPLAELPGDPLSEQPSGSVNVHATAANGETSPTLRTKFLLAMSLSLCCQHKRTDSRECFTQAR